MHPKVSSARDQKVGAIQRSSFGLYQPQQPDPGRSRAVRAAAREAQVPRPQDPMITQAAAGHSVSESVRVSDWHRNLNADSEEFRASLRIVIR
eukprot:452859-Rhodomonas_salina.4